MRDAIPGIDSPAELILLPILLPPTIFPEFVIRGPKFPKTGEAANPGAEFRLPTLAKFEDKPCIEPPIAFMLLLNPAEFRLPTLAKFEDKPCIEPPIAFMLLLNPGFPPTFIPPLLLIPE